MSDFSASLKVPDGVLAINVKLSSVAGSFEMYNISETKI
jgi:hypothetical protein